MPTCNMGSPLPAVEGVLGDAGELAGPAGRDIRSSIPAGSPGAPTPGPAAWGRSWPFWTIRSCLARAALWRMRRWASFSVKRSRPCSMTIPVFRSNLAVTTVGWVRTQTNTTTSTTIPTRPTMQTTSGMGPGLRGIGRGTAGGAAGASRGAWTGSGNCSLEPTNDAPQALHFILAALTALGTLNFR